MPGIICAGAPGGGVVRGRPDASTYGLNPGECGGGWVGACDRGAGIGSLVCAPTLACSTFGGGVAVPLAGVLRDARGLRSSLTAGAWIFAASAGGAGPRFAGTRGFCGSRKSRVVVTPSPSASSRFTGCAPLCVSCFLCLLFFVLL